MSTTEAFSVRNILRAHLGAEMIPARWPNDTPVTFLSHHSSLGQIELAIGLLEFADEENVSEARMRLRGVLHYLTELTR